MDRLGTGLEGTGSERDCYGTERDKDGDRNGDGGGCRGLRLDFGFVRFLKFYEQSQLQFDKIVRQGGGGTWIHICTYVTHIRTYNEI